HQWRPQTGSPVSTLVETSLRGAMLPGNTLAMSGSAGTFHVEVKSIDTITGTATVALGPGSVACGDINDSCCTPDSMCQPDLVCDVNNRCVCGGVNQPCCNLASGGTCNDASLICDQRIGKCITSCGHFAQSCCAGITCNGDLVCANGVCSCGGQNQPCCA